MRHIVSIFFITFSFLLTSCATIGWKSSSFKKSKADKLTVKVIKLKEDLKDVIARSKKLRKSGQELQVTQSQVQGLEGQMNQLAPGTPQAMQVSSAFEMLMERRAQLREKGNQESYDLQDELAAIKKDRKKIIKKLKKALRKADSDELLDKLEHQLLVVREMKPVMTRTKRYYKRSRRSYQSIAENTEDFDLNHPKNNKVGSMAYQEPKGFSDSFGNDF